MSMSMSTLFYKYVPIHTGEKLFSCAACEFKCEGYKELNYHMHAKHEDKLHLKDIVGQKYVRR